jgi:2-polyprenyl-3-methyl-5-hydroxy-6-metoxy-1,4-benzoquinol methylase
MTLEYDPDLYHLLHRGNPGDLIWYQKRCASAARVLELGCGDGRILLPLAQAGAAVVGLDHHAGMLELCAQRFKESGLQAELICGDMTAFALPWRFDRVIIPYNSIYCLMSDRQQLACLRAARAHLAPGGKVLLDAYAADPVCAADTVLTTVAPHPVALFHDGDRQIEVVEHSVEDLEKQTIHATYDYQITFDDGRREKRSWTIPQRYVFPTQMLALLARADLALEGFFGDFDEGPFTEMSMQMVVVAGAELDPEGARA